MSQDNIEPESSTQTVPRGGAPAPRDLDFSVTKPRSGSSLASPDSLLAARAIHDTSGRRTDAPVRKGFVRGTTSEPAPLGRMYSGGRGGTVAIKLYLGLIWRSSSAPYETDKPARSWATLLDLPDASRKGARRIAAAMRTLEEGRLITTRPQPGHPSLVSLLDENGRGRPYELPSTSHIRARTGHRSKAEIASHVYFKVSTELWTGGYLQHLKGPGLVMLLILLAERGGEGERVWFSTEAFEDRYSISHQTRSTGTKQLVELGLLRVERESIAKSAYANVFDPQRMRNVYHLRGPALNKVA